jgi:hypothetical protein
MHCILAWSCFDECPKFFGATMSDVPNYTWMKMPIALLEDEEFMTLSDGATSAYLKIYLMAGKVDAGGALADRHGAMDVKRLAWRLRTDTDHLNECLTELTQAGLMTLSNNGYEITRFMEEQGPGDNEQREKWRERQKKHRARLKLDLEKEEEEEVDIESHGDITVTGATTTGPAAKTTQRVDDSSSSTNPHSLVEVIANELREQEREPNYDAIEAAIVMWNDEVQAAADDGAYWKPTNKDAILERYDTIVLSEDARHGLYAHRLSGYSEE